MKKSREPVCSREAPLALWPACWKEMRTASSRPNSRKAVMIDTSVSTVRVLRRNSAAQIRWRYFIASGGGRRVGRDQRALVQMQRMARAAGGLRIVRDHHDGLAVLAVQRAQQRQHALGRFAVQVAGGFVADEQG